MIIQSLHPHSLMPQTGIEPVREYKSRRILSPVRLPVPPLRRIMKNFSAFQMDGEGFEPSKALPTDLQSDPFGHSGIRPYVRFSQPDKIYLYHTFFIIAIDFLYFFIFIFHNNCRIVSHIQYNLSSVNQILVILRCITLLIRINQTV